MPTQRDRYYSAPPSVHNVSTIYGWSPTATWTGNNGVVGNWIPASMDASGRLDVNVGGITLSGAQIEVNTDALEALTMTGIRFESGISGQLASVIKTDNPSGYAPYTGVVQTHRAVVTSGYNPQFASGAPAVAAVDTTNGGVLAVMSDLSADVDAVTTYPATSTTSSNYVPSGGIGTMVTGLAIPANPNRIAWGISNIGSGSNLFLKFGSPPVSTGSFTLILKPGTSDFSADGGSFLDTPAMYRGDVSVSGSNVRFMVWEM